MIATVKAPASIVLSRDATGVTIAHGKQTLRLTYQQAATLGRALQAFTKL
jgi:hypothetical protein